VPVDGEGIDDAPEVWDDYAWSQFAAAHGHLLAQRDLLQRPTAAILEYGLELTGPRRLEARRRAEQIAAWFDQRLREVDVLLAPTTPFPAPPADSDLVQVRDAHSLSVRRGAVSILTRPVNLAGLPAVSLPAGFSGDGLPLSVHVIGRRGGEETLLEVAATLEESDDRFRARRAPYPPRGLEEGTTAPPGIREG
jgi:Asp-tRNA(Asn)/Glu-tRNA(Gln) amidotransferase A subunit family amidase